MLIRKKGGKIQYDFNLRETSEFLEESVVCSGEKTGAAVVQGQFGGYCHGASSLLLLSPPLLLLLFLKFRGVKSDPQATSGGVEIGEQPKKLKLYSYWRSSCAFRVRIALNLKGLLLLLLLPLDYSLILMVGFLFYLHSGGSSLIL